MLSADAKTGRGTATIVDSAVTINIKILNNCIERDFIFTQIKTLEQARKNASSRVLMHSCKNVYT
ncbi:MAG: hypothetical protein PVH94_17045, partial [Desulfobacterales bacterium]